MGTPLPAPDNVFVRIFNQVLKTLIQGLGVEAAIAAATIQVPELAAPVIKWIFRKIVEFLASNLYTNEREYFDILIVKYQDASKKVEYDGEIDAYKKVISTPGVSDAEKAKALQDAKNAIDNLVHRAKLLRENHSQGR